MLGLVKSYNPEKKYGFLETEDSKSFFVHISMINSKDGEKQLFKYEPVTFDIGTDKKSGRTVAINVVPIWRTDEADYPAHNA
ncbi:MULTISPECIES: cold shock domain-containing protein [unclassified Paenibacillus]|uniref:cold shock domain-containing protein n=1 Tax=unclassified Paenibacillus TaxID=185978 RepID=UPI00362BB459